MTEENFNTTIVVSQSRDDVFAAINDVRGWWSQEIEGGTEKLGDEFVFSYQDMHRCTQKVTQLVQGEKVTWHVVDGYLSFTQDSAEWAGTDITFDIARIDEQTEVRFTHVGIVPASECFPSCSNAWNFLIKQSLHDLITTGKGQPIQREKVDGGKG